MSKRSRSESKSSPSRYASTETRSEVTEASPAHTPKYFRSSPSPVNDLLATSTIDRPMQCTLPPHGPTTLPSAAAFDNHYNQEHTNRCAECAANLPSSWFLELHLSERHDPLVEGLREKGEKTYKCFIPTCEKLTSVPQKRRLHLIDKHGYPRNYDFRVVDCGIGNRTSLLRSNNANPSTRRRRISEVGDQNWRAGGRAQGDMGRGGRSRRGTIERSWEDRSKINDLKDTKVEEKPEDSKVEGYQDKHDKHDRLTSKAASAENEEKVGNNDEMETLASGMASLKFVPMSVRMKDGRKAK